MASQQGRIVGSVKYREGDGVEIEIPQGPCEIVVTELDATISWHDGDTHGSTGMPLDAYERYVAIGAIRLDP